MALTKTGTKSSGAAATGANAKRHMCNVCGRPSDEEICAKCADRIRAEALATTAGEAPQARVKPGLHPLETKPKRPLR